MIPLIIFTLTGLAFNITGTFLIAFSITFLHKTRLYYDNDGKKAYVEGHLAKFKKCRFWCGVCTLIIGFIVQFTGVLLDLILSCGNQ